MIEYRPVDLNGHAVHDVAGSAREVNLGVGFAFIGSQRDGDPVASRDVFANLRHHRMVLQIELRDDALIQLKAGGASV